MTPFLTLDDIDVRGKTVLVRCDLNVPMQQGRITDFNRILRLMPTLQYLSSKGAKTVLLSHFGRPKGEYVPSMSLAPLADALTEVLGGVDIHFGVDCVGPEAQRALKDLGQGEILLLENLRFHPEEEANEPEFAKKLAALGDVFVNDAFSCAHRAHASTVGVTAHLPAVAGRLMEGELQALSAALDAPERPIAAIVGGAKVSTKLKLLNRLVEKVDTLIIGGGMANTFLHAQGVPVGNSLCEKNMADTAQAILAHAKETGCRILLPLDVVVARSLTAHASCRVIAPDAIKEGEMILDAGPESVVEIIAVLKASKTLVWNGPIGAFETSPFDVSGSHIARVAAALTQAGKLKTIAGGGDTVSAMRHVGLAGQMSYLSTAGGAFLEWLEGRELPGVAALYKAKVAA